MDAIEKASICMECEHFNKEIIKCKLVCCKNLYNSLLQSKLGKCPKNKW